MTVFSIIIVLVAVIIICLYRWYEEEQYKKTEYYSQTGNSYSEINNDKGRAGEFETWEQLKGLPGYKKCLFNCYIPKRNRGTTEIDFILIHETGIYIFESKNYGGWIYGSENRKFWLQTLPRGRRGIQRNTFFNPIIQNKSHMKWLARFINLKPDYFNTYVVFSERCTFKKMDIDSVRHRVVYMGQLFSAMTEQIRDSSNVLTDDEIDALYEKLQPLTKVNEEEKFQHVQSIRENTEPVKLSEYKANPYNVRCPSCGSRLVIRHAKRGKFADSKFLGCSNYPRCRYTRDLVDDI